MTMGREEALSFIHGTHKFGSKLGLENTKVLLEKIGNPQNRLRFIHIAGTNGKGSTASYIHSILKESGWTVGIYTSPYLERFEERIRIGNRLISEEAMEEGVALIREKIQEMLEEGYSHPTEFEVVTALAFWYYEREKVDMVVLEVGLGGRFDSTNVVDNTVLSIITSISFDHVDILGDTLSKIAYEKAGIIKERVPVLSYFQEEEVIDVLESVAKDKKAEISFLDRTNLCIKEKTPEKTTFLWKERTYQTPLLGEHQVYNAILAIEAIHRLNQLNITQVDELTIQKGIFHTKWPGRLEILSKSPLFLIDGAHNEQGAQSLVSAVKEYFPNKEVILMVGMLADKDVKALQKIYSQFADAIYVCQPDNPRALSKETLYQQTKGQAKRVYLTAGNKEAVEEALKRESKESVFILTGSLYLIGDMRRWLREKFDILYEYETI